MRRGAYFFILDAFIAGIIIISTLTIMFSALTTPENPRQSYVLAEDFMIFLERTEVQEYAGESVYEHAIADRSVSLLEQVATFYHAGEQDAATNMLEELSRLAPEQNAIAFYISSQAGAPTLLYNNTLAGSLEESRIRLSSQRLVTVRESVTPYVLEVRMWR